MVGLEAATDTSGEQLRDPFLGELLCERYRVDACIGRGGMGIVYQGTHLSLGKPVAIKRLDRNLSTDASAFERFRGEAVAASRVDSPHVVQVFDWGKSSDGSPFIVMELLKGQNLRDYLDQEGRLLPLQAARITQQILSGLGRIHHAQILHRDIKPENVFLCAYDDASTFVKLLDFGISKRLDADPAQAVAHSTRAGVILGTALYMSPEQAKGDMPLDARSDLYSVGAVLFEMLTGRPPHRGRTFESILVDICTRDAEDIRVHCPLVSSELAKIVADALKRDPRERVASCAQFQHALGLAVPELGGELRANSSRPSLPAEALGALPTLPQNTAFANRMQLPPDGPGQTHSGDSLGREKAARASTADTGRLASPAAPRSRRLALAVLGTLALCIGLGALLMAKSWPWARANEPSPPGLATAIGTSARSRDLSIALRPAEVSATLPAVTRSPGTAALGPPPASAMKPVASHPESTKAAPTQGPEGRPSRTASAPTSGEPPALPANRAGVLGGLKLRRSMP